ncbi:MAG: DEAD/DEAH box helicase, partial [Planctomycetia bacterium]|nr:DEAD/DEAH box helicase [Planctomycetia bacterium]
MAPPSTPNPNSPDSFDAAQDASVEEELQRLMLAEEYIQSLPYAPYQFQREAIEAWFSSNHGVLVSAPTGMGKTLIAEAALFEALKTGKRAYYTTPLIALTEQKFRELQESAVRWGFSKSDVGLVTGNRRENIDAPILVVVAEILFNRLISSDAFESFARKDRDPNSTIAPATFDVNAQKKTSVSAAQLNAKQSLVLKDDSRPQTESIEETNQNKRVIVVPENPEDYEDEEFRELENAHFSFEDVSAVVMDEFHQFSDPERGVVWEFSLALLPNHIRTLLISATVGNAAQFVNWLKTTANRSLELITSTERRTPLEYHWVDDRFLEEQLVDMCQGDEDVRTTPALVFCFNRDECWSVAENVSGKPLVDQDQKTRVIEELANYDLRSGAGPKLEKLLKRGVGIHHAGIMPKYRRIIEDLFQKKLLSFCVCTETLAAGINLPARSVVLPTLLKGPKANRRLVEPSTAQQIFGRAGRPQYDDVGYVFALAPRIDVEHDRALRNLERDLPENSKDPQIIKLRKKKLKNLPMRKPGVVYWTDKQFTDLAKTAAGALTSRGPIPWRLLAHMIECNANLTPIRRLVAQRLMGAKRLDAMQKALDQMFLTLWRGGFVRLAPNPVSYGLPATAAAHRAYLEHRRRLKEEKRRSQPFAAGLFDVDILNDDSNDEEFDTDAFLLASRDAAKTPEEPSFAKGVLAQEELSPLDGFDFFGGPDLFDLQDDDASHSADPIAEEPNTSPEEQTPNQDASVESEVADLLFGLTLGSSAPKVAKPEKNAKAKKTKSAGKTDARPIVTETSDAKSTRTPQTDPSLLDANGALDLSKLTPQEREELVTSYRAKFAYPTEKLRTIT